MQWFKNLSIYQLTQPINLSQLETSLNAFAFTPCSLSENRKIGWISPFGENSDVLFHELEGQILLCMQQEDKILPRFVINDTLRKRVQQMEEQLQKKISRTDKNSIKEQITIELLSKAFSRYRTTALWIDTLKQRIIIGSSSAHSAEEILNLLRKTLNTLSVTPLKGIEPAESVMTQWLKNNTLPDELTLLNEVELKNFMDNSKIKAVEQDIQSDEINQHLLAGKLVTQLALNWSDRINFILTHELKLKRLKYTLASEASSDEIAVESASEQIDADFFLFTTELQLLLDKVVAWFHLTPNKLSH